MPRSADATTILAIFVALQFVLPSRLALNYLPMSLSPATAVALGLGALWLCTQMNTTLGAAKGRSPVRSMLFAYSCVLLASYASSAMSYLDGDERGLADTTLVRVSALILVGLAACDGVRSLAGSTSCCGWSSSAPPSSPCSGSCSTSPASTSPRTCASRACTSGSRPIGGGPQRSDPRGRHYVEPAGVRRVLSR